MKRIIHIIILLLSINLFSQTGKIFIETNYNTFSHSKLSSFQQEFAKDIPQVPIVTNDDFPSNFGFTLGYEITDIQTSFFVSYNFTGGKLSYSDYSGIVKLEEPLNAYTVGGMYHLHLNDKKDFKIGFKGFTMFSKLKIDSYSKLGNNIRQESVKLSSVDFGLGVSLIYEYPISFFILRANLGYDLVFGGKLNFDNIDNSHLINNSGKEVNTGWSGLRTGFGVAIPIN